ncbi:MAG: HNH endonuclease signature motif containing protein [Gemmatimonadaceae bacterium]
MRARLLKHRRITPSGCWEWTRGCDDFGYGQITVGNKTQSVHRMAYQEFIGPIPDGKSVLHSCDNPPCFNPEHFFLGTQLANMRDRNAKGRDNNFWRGRSSCSSGHEYTPANTSIRVRKGRRSRVCLACKRDRQRRSA